MIHGASGAVGNAAVQIARSMGVTVVGTAGTKDGMEVVLKCGVSNTRTHYSKSSFFVQKFNFDFPIFWVKNS